MRDFSRTKRVAELLHRELADVIRTEIRDPRLGPVTLTDVRVSKDLGQARIYISALTDTKAAHASVEILNHAAGYLRGILGHRLHLRTIPRLVFEFDEVLDRGARVSSLLDAIAHGSPTPDGNDS